MEIPVLTNIVLPFPDQVHTSASSFSLPQEQAPLQMHWQHVVQLLAHGCLV